MGLTDRQQVLLDTWLPSAQLVKDHSWGLIGTLVLELIHNGERYIAKAGDAADHHLAREIRAHRNWLTPWTSRGRAPEFVRVDDDAKLLLTRFLPGELVEGTPAEWAPATYDEAGELLAQFHQQSAVRDDAYESRENQRTLADLGKAHRIAPDLTERLQAEIAGWPTPPAILVPTHGDWQPRNWLTDRGIIRVIDFGRADLRPAYTDLARLAAQQFRSNPELEAAFLSGYGSDPREPAAWHRAQLREAVNTCIWAYQVGDEPFEQQGHRMIAEAIS
ncbi:aminoglycoside phosphotransferase family protein [Kribbella pratensis]|uniref:Phosphotransferase family enzyme n=1 Tax=Kribbella pratensis TaxID=2512112 RepID=A0A4V3GHN2_9ACTN|nr:aminoglycoside phosphotransferase family protein [Kribbella pratensis]TDW76767.1 phosphotransferase family enzyme [Kribbella pratensis]